MATPYNKSAVYGSKLTMATQLEMCIKLKQWSVINFLYAEVITPVEINHHIVCVYGSSCI